MDAQTIRQDVHPTSGSDERISVSRGELGSLRRMLVRLQRLLAHEPQRSSPRRSNPAIRLIGKASTPVRFLFDRGPTAGLDSVPGVLGVGQASC
jgi:hypothetical protein